MSTAVRLERTIPASPSRVYRAWLEPETMRRWLAPVEGGTRLTLVHDRLDGLGAAWPQVGDAVEEGWTGTLGRLAGTLGLPAVVAQDEWDAALKDFVAREKEATRAQDALSAARRALPMVAVEKDYVLDGPDGKVRLLELFEGRRQLIVYHFMFHPDWDAGCPSCSFLVDNLPHHDAHLHRRDTTLAVVSRAPRTTLRAYQERMGWDFSWFSSGESDFNYDFHATLDERVAPVQYNFENREELERRGLAGFDGMEVPGASVFLRDGDRIFHTYSTYARGTEAFLATFRLLDLTALGRQEEWERPEHRYTELVKPILRHDEYGPSAGEYLRGL